MAEEATGAEHVLEHGTARVQKARGEGGKGKESERGKDGKKPKHKIKRMVIEPAEGGGHVVTHEFHQPRDGKTPPEEEKRYAVPDTQALHDHIEEHLGQPNPGEAEAEAGSEAGAGGAGAGEGGGAAEAAMEQAGGGEEA